MLGRRRVREGVGVIAEEVAEVEGVGDGFGDCYGGFGRDRDDCCSGGRQRIN